MKIKHVRTHILQAGLSEPFAYSRAWYDTRTAMVVEIETDNGLSVLPGSRLPWSRA